MKSVKAPFPFLWFGRRPKDWYEGANDGHAYEICFAQAPTEKERAKIVAAFKKSLRSSAATMSKEPWLWSSRFALAFTGEKSAGEIDAFFDAMDTAVRAVHALAPIEQVVFVGTRGAPTHAWDDHTKASGRAPLAGPAWEGHRLPDWFRRGANAKLARGAAPKEKVPAAKPGAPVLIPLKATPPCAHTAQGHATPSDAT
jgi:hypothetical protein